MREAADFPSGLVSITKLALDLAETIPTPIVLIDGRAGSGKSSFAEELRNELFRQSDAAPVVVHMDDLYPGWEGLRAGSSYLIQNILAPLSQGKTAHWQLWDWAAGERGNQGEPGNGWREFSGGNILIVEGCGSLSRQSSELASLSVWIEAETAVRRSRWQQRDGEKFAGYWGVWQAQEDEFYEAERASLLAQLVVEN